MRPYPPTRLQATLERFIRGYDLAHGCAPTLDEMARGVGLFGKPGAKRVVDQLIERGRARRRPHTTRGVALLTCPAIPFAPDGAPLFVVPGFGEPD